MRARSMNSEFAGLRCSAPDCGADAIIRTALGVCCNKHYLRILSHGNFDPTDLTGLTEDQHDAIKRAICPCCEYALPETRRSDSSEWWHSLPRTEFEMPCRANDYRNLRAQQVNAAATQ